MSVFDRLVGQPAASATLREAAAAAAARLRGEPEHAMTHAWLFVGPPGSGRSVAARAFAAALQCPDEGCGACPACRTVLAGSHPDVEVVATKGVVLPIKEARAIVARASGAPVQGRWQVTVVEDADRMDERTANVLLKAIEEPPPRGVFLLCAPSTEDLLPTIRSRCRVVALRIPATAAVVDVLVAEGVERSMAAFAAAASGGHVGRARHLATDEQARERRRAALDLLSGLRSIGACFVAGAELLAAADEEAAQVAAALEPPEEEVGTGRGRRRGGLTKQEEETRRKSRRTRAQRDALDRALLDIAAFHRDVLSVQLGAGLPLTHVDVVDRVNRVASLTTPETSVRRIEAVLACREGIAGNVAPLLAVENLMLALRSG